MLLVLSKADDKDNPLYESPFEVTIEKKDLDNWTINHPSSEVDLCAILAHPVLNAFKNAVYKYIIRTHRSKISQTRMP